MSWLEQALFVPALLVAGLVGGALAWAGPAPYLDIARDNGVATLTFIGPASASVTYDLARAAELHAGWSSYVTGGAEEPPVSADVPFSDDERRHMGDVRRVFEGLRFAIPLALFVLAVRLQRWRARSARMMWSMVRRGVLAAVVLVALAGVGAIVAFEPLFLLFHRVFFPQGNYLFDPASSNLVRLYPDWYWEGITLRVGLTFVGAGLAIAAIATARLRAAK
ncbi:MAG TPA: DUF1461 domain-containing protein [Candidatus Limnocylindria bacterium]|nr:DUF1461 domain-containing protein [Candidatus Limnocylindria bacterium]